MMASVIKEHYQDEQIARDYDRERFSNFAGKTFDRLEKRALVGMLRKVRKSIAQPRVLDIPCGTGRITELWLQQGLQVLGGDISEAMIAVAREKCTRFSSDVDFRRLDLDGLDIADSSFDLVTCIRLFHHLNTAERAPIMKELARVSSRFVLVNVSFSSGYYRFRRRVKHWLRQGISKTSSTWSEILTESNAAGLHMIGCRMVLPFVSEDMIVLFEKQQ